MIEDTRIKLVPDSTGLEIDNERLKWLLDRYAQTINDLVVKLEGPYKAGDLPLHKPYLSREKSESLEGYLNE
jgi:hypothetical protein